MSAQGQGQQPAGWYKDPWGQAQARYWDGSQWTSHVQGQAQATQATTVLGAQQARQATAAGAAAPRAGAGSSGSWVARKPGSAIALGLVAIVIAFVGGGAVGKFILGGSEKGNTTTGTTSTVPTVPIIPPTPTPTPTVPEPEPTPTLPTTPTTPETTPTVPTSPKNR